MEERVLAHRFLESEAEENENGDDLTVMPTHNASDSRGLSREKLTYILGLN